ncbi:hypothetical protein ACIFQM_19465 [Paenibacillus sp. NRS-1782]|uniref:hypothetical protein n=1 Tax=unclassified Paenibacillus TaxID=185978 RepID=UPI003D28BFA5
MSVAQLNRLIDGQILYNQHRSLFYMHEGNALMGPPCEEYTPELQAKLLGLDIARLQEPVLDVGCGAEARLVGYLRSLGIEAYGTDRLAGDNLQGRRMGNDYLSYGVLQSFYTSSFEIGRQYS